MKYLDSKAQRLTLTLSTFSYKRWNASKVYFYLMQFTCSISVSRRVQCRPTYSSSLSQLVAIIVLWTNNSNYLYHFLSVSSYT